MPADESSKGRKKLRADENERKETNQRPSIAGIQSREENREVSNYEESANPIQSPTVSTPAITIKVRSLLRRVAATTIPIAHNANPISNQNHAPIPRPSSPSES